MRRSFLMVLSFVACSGEPGPGSKAPQSTDSGGCVAAGTCTPTPGACEGACPEDCADGIDNDEDGLADCEDTDCDGSCPEVCDDSRDNDGDGATDCEDTDCDGQCPEVCEDGRDNDGDGATDCEDTDCDGDCAEVCDDGRDNDGNGFTDCEDQRCEEICDADGDGHVAQELGGDDCDDDDDSVYPDAPEACASPIDLDCDGLVPACTLSMPPLDREYVHDSRARGVVFTAPADFTIVSLSVPDDIGGGEQNVEVVRFPSFPPNHPERTSDFDTLLSISGIPEDDKIVVSLDVNMGDVIGVLGSRGTDEMYSSYGLGAPGWAADIHGIPVVLNRLVFHGNMADGPVTELSADTTNPDLGRVNVEFR
jgi:hypothetical protein